MLMDNILKLRPLIVASCKFSDVKINFFSTQRALLAGHSKWANIRHIKAQKDGQKAAIFTKLSRQIRFAIQEGGSVDTALNSLLRNVVEEALRKNMPMASIQNSIKKSQQSKVQLKKYHVEMRYKQKVFVICIVYTDNFPGVKMDLGTILRKAGAAYVDVNHMFDDYGLIEATLDKSILQSGISLNERALNDAIECGAEEFEILDEKSGIVNFVCSPIELNRVQNSIAGRGYSIESMEHMFSAKNMVKLSPEELITYNVFVQKLRDVPGLEDIYDNVQLDEVNKVK